MIILPQAMRPKLQRAYKVSEPPCKCYKTKATRVRTFQTTDPMPNFANAIANVMKVFVYYSAQLITPGCAIANRKGLGDVRG